MLEDKQRVDLRRNNRDAESSTSLSFNEWSGGQKNMSVGAYLKGLGVLTSATKVEAGAQLWIWTATPGSLITFGADSTVTLGTLGAERTYPLEGNVYTHLCVGDTPWVISAAGVYVFIVEDTTTLRNK